MRISSCDNCGAPLNAVPGRNYLQCPYCLSFHFPTEQKDGVVPGNEFSGHACPVCARPLVRSSVEGVDAHWCENCHGLLLERRNFTRIVEIRRAMHRKGYDVDEVAEELDIIPRHLRCPGCHGTMETHPYFGPGRVVIDACGNCHLIWLDPGELTIIESSR